MRALDYAKAFGLPLLLALASGYAVFFIYTSGDCDIVNFYQSNLRSSLFAGFLTMGGFLLSLKTGILIRIKETLYDSKEYDIRYKESLSLGPRTGRYDPLRRLSFVLSIAVLSCLVASALQFTLGLLSTWWATSVCVSIAVFAMSALFVSFKLIQDNLLIWFDFLEDQKPN